MKNIIYSLLFVGILFSCENKNTENSTENTAKTEEKPVEQANVGFFGAKITEDDAIPADQLLAKMKGADSLRVKIKGKIIECCKKKGCWMTVDIGNGKSLRVSFKDYSFFVPKDGDGKEVVFSGLAKKSVTKEADLKHFAEDAGKSKEEIAKIKGDKEEVEFEADGVIIK